MRDELVRVTGGNPLALLELPAALTDDERTGRAPLRLDLPLNERIERAFMARVDAARATTRGGCSCWPRPTTAATSGRCCAPPRASAWGPTPSMPSSGPAC